MIYSLEVEKHVLCGFLRYPKTMSDNIPFITDNDFYNQIHKTIFCVIKQAFLKGDSVDKILVGQTIKNMNLSFEDDINVFDYLEGLSLIQINTNAVKSLCQELKKFTIARELSETAADIGKAMKSSLDKSPLELISIADKIYNKKISLYSLSDEPQDLFEGMEALVEDRGNNPMEETGLMTPYQEFNRLFGGLRDGNLYCVLSRPGEGKSTFLSDICYKASVINNKNVKSLILDTEMETNDIKFRMVSSLSGVPMWFLETGKWRHNEEMVNKVRKTWPLVKQYIGGLSHFYVAGKPIEEIISIIKRWYYSKVGRGQRALVAYDYIKLTGEKVSDSWKEYQAIGSKIDSLKQVTVELSLPLFAACQLNRTGTDGAVDDSSAIAQSDRLQWFASFVAIFRRKNLEEIAVDGEQYGSHKLIPLKTRFQGRDAAGHHDLVRVTEAGKVKYKSNYLNFNVNNFNVEERGSLRQMMEQRVGNVNINNNAPTGDLL